MTTTMLSETIESGVETSMMDAALAYAKQGRYIFPCDENGKEPHATGSVDPITGKAYRLAWGKYATNDPKQIKAWWTSWPNANIGFPAKPNGVIVIDVDFQGMQNWRSILAQYPDIAETWTQNTPGGGCHVIYRAPDAVIGNRDLAPGINVRGVKGDGGYIVLTPSVHPNGMRYHWSYGMGPDEIEIAPLPQYLIDLLATPRTASNPPAVVERPSAECRSGQSAYTKAALDGEVDRVRHAINGTRNNTLNKSSFALGQFVGSGELNRSEVDNKLLNAALTSGLSESEARATINSGIEAGIREPRSTPPKGGAFLDREDKPRKDQAPAEGSDRAEPDFSPLEDILECLGRQEAGDAELLARRYAGRILYDRTEGQWYIYQGHYWAADKAGQTERLIYTDIAAQYQYASALKFTVGDKDLSNELSRRANSLRTYKRIRNVLSRELAGSIPSISTTGELWDTDRMVLGTPNGAIDLRAGTFRPGQPTDYIRTIAPTEWKGIDAPCPRWEQFQNEIHGDDQKIIDFMWRWHGYNITGSTEDHVMVIEYGEEGRNGKGTEAEMLKGVLGDIAKPTKADALMDIRSSDGNAATPYVYDLRGRRMVWASETKEGRRLDVSLVKFLTGGDTIPARTLNSKPIEFKPTHKITLLTNHKPHIDGGGDAALWERLRLVPYEQRFVDEPEGENEHPRDPKLTEKLQAEASGILAWLVRGCLEWQKRGLVAPDKIRVATSEYRKEEDHFPQFLSDEVEAGDAKDKVASAALWERYGVWCYRNDRKDKLGRVKFGKRLAEKYARKEEGDNDIAFYYGLKLRGQRTSIEME
jgi:putative DNA primase/helicase